jgi:hypothetical protein
LYRKENLNIIKIILKKMKSEILRQIEQNKRAYYHTLSSLKNDSKPIFPPIDENEVPSHKDGFDDLNVIRPKVKKLSFHIPVPKISVNKKFKNIIGRTIKKAISKLGLLNSKFNLYLIAKTDKVIDRFYQFGAKVFDVNEANNNQMSFSAESIMVNDMSSPLVMQLPAIPFFETIQKLMRDVIIYFESDNFNFSSIKLASIPNRIKKEEYQSFCHKKGYATFAFVNKLMKNKTFSRISERITNINDSIKPGIHRGIHKINFPAVYKFKNRIIESVNPYIYKKRSSLFKSESKIHI